MDEKKIPVLKKEDSSVHWIDLSKICFSSIDSREIAYHTSDEVYYHLKNLDELSLALGPKGFEKLDRGNLVQMSKITYYDSVYGKVFFDEVITSESDYATVSQSYIKKLEKSIDKDRDISKKNKT